MWEGNIIKVNKNAFQKPCTFFVFFCLINFNYVQRRKYTNYVKFWSIFKIKPKLRLFDFFSVSGSKGFKAWLFIFIDKNLGF